MVAILPGRTGIGGVAWLQLSSRPEASPLNIEDSLWRSVAKDGEPDGLTPSLGADLLVADSELDGLTFSLNADVLTVDGESTDDLTLSLSPYVLAAAGARDDLIFSLEEKVLQANAERDVLISSPNSVASVVVVVSAPEAGK